MNENEIKALIAAELASYDLSREIQVEIPDEDIKKAVQANIGPFLLEAAKEISALRKRIEALEMAAAKPAAPAGGRVNVVAKVKAKGGA